MTFFPRSFLCVWVVVGLTGGACVVEPVAPDTPEICSEGFSKGSNGLCLENWDEDLAVLHEDFEASSSEALTEFCAQYDAVYGNLTVRIEAATNLDELSCLQKVGGHLRLDDMESLTELSLPLLDQVNGDLNVQANGALEQLDLPKLREVGGSVAIQYLRELDSLELPRLRSVGGFLTIYNTTLTEIVLPELETIGDPEAGLGHVFYVRVNTDLLRLEVPRLREVVGVMKISSNHQLVEISMPSLTKLGAGFYLSWTTELDSASFPVEEIDGFFYLQHTRMRSFSMPCLRRVGGQFAVNWNENLEEAFFPELQLVEGTFDVQNNPELPENWVDGWLAQLEDDPMGNPRVSNNGLERPVVVDAPSCP